MCGIAGFVEEFVPGLMGRMNSLQAHRGPKWKMPEFTLELIRAVSYDTIDNKE
jgi:asparagine synthetase B (glutamine-hydrolysing)